MKYTKTRAERRAVAGLARHPQPSVFDSPAVLEELTLVADLIVSLPSLSKVVGKGCKVTLSRSDSGRGVVFRVEPEAYVFGGGAGAGATA